MAEPTAPAELSARPGPGRPRRRTPSVDTRLLAAIERLRAQGQAFGSVSVEALVAEAGIARATFYLHFKDKGALVARLLGRITDDVVASAGIWFDDARNAGPAEVRAALVGIVGTFKKHQTVFAAVADMARTDAEVAALHQQMMDRLCAASRTAVADVRAAGRAAPGADDALADLLTWLIELYCARFISQLDDRALQALIDRLAHVCARAIFLPEL